MASSLEPVCAVLRAFRALNVPACGVERMPKEHIEQMLFVRVKGRKRRSEEFLDRALRINTRTPNLCHGTLPFLVGSPIQGILRLSAGKSKYYPTLPSISNCMRRLSSTAYSMGSSLTIGSMKPLMMAAEASDGDRPRVCK